MKKLFLFFLIINTISFKTQEIDKTYYLLGAVDEYMGRSYEMKNPNWKGFLLKIHDNDSLQIKRIETITEIKPKKINIELKKYNEKLSVRPQIVVANKMDILEDIEIFYRNKPDTYY